jgi:hypothetical protein
VRLLPSILRVLRFLYAPRVLKGALRQLHKRCESSQNRTTQKKSLSTER